MNRMTYRWVIRVVLEVVQRYATVGLDCSSKARRLGRLGGTSVFCPKVVAPGAVPHVELVADDRKEHGVGTVQEMPVLDGVEPDVGRKFRRSPPVPAGTVKVLRLGHLGAAWLLGLFRDVIGRKRRTVAEEEFLHVLGDQFLCFLLERHQPVLVEDHLHPLLPEFPRVGRYVLVNSLAQFAGPWRRGQPWKLFLELDAENRPPAR